MAVEGKVVELLPKGYYSVESHSRLFVCQISSKLRIQNPSDLTTGTSVIIELADVPTMDRGRIIEIK